MSGEQAVSLNVLAIDKVFDYFEVENKFRLELLDRVQAISASAINEQIKESNRRLEMERNKRR